MKMREEDFVKRGVDLKELDKNIKNKFKWEWLQDKVDGGGFFSDCFRKIKEAGLVYCIICEDKINYGSSGKKALANHVKRPVHVKKYKEKKTDKSTQPALAALFQNIKKLETGVAPNHVSDSPLPYGTPENVQEANVKLVVNKAAPPRVVDMTDRKSHQEALICAFIAENSLPISLAPRIVALAQELSRDHKALNSLKLDRTCASYKLKDGLSEVFKKRLVNQMKNISFSINVDESTLKANKKRVLNVLVCFFDVDLRRSVTQLFASIEMTTVNAETVFNAIIGKIREEDIPLANLVSVLSDSAAYMRGKNTGFQVRLKEILPTVLDIDGDVCHHLFNIVKTFGSKADPEDYMKNLFRDVHRDFMFSADLREDLAQMTKILKKQFLLPVEFVPHRWLSMLDATTRFIEIIDQLTLFYFAWAQKNEKEKYNKTVTAIMRNLTSEARCQVFNILRRIKLKNMTPFGKNRKLRIVAKLFSHRDKTLFLCNLFKSVIPLFTQCILTLEKETPQIHKLHDKALETFKSFLTYFLKPEVLNKANIKTLDVTVKENCLPVKEIFIGTDTAKVLNKMSDDVKKDMMTKVKTAYLETGAYMKKKLPLNNRLIICLSAIDPLARTHTLTREMMRELNQLVHLPESDDFLLQLSNYHTDDTLPHPQDCVDIALDAFWAQVLVKYPALSPLLHKCLSIFTGPKVESSFSMLNNVIDSSTNRMAISTSEAYQRVKYVLLSHKKTSVEFFKRPDCLYSPVDSALCYHIQTARRRAVKKTFYNISSNKGLKRSLDITEVETGPSAKSSKFTQ